MSEDERTKATEQFQKVSAAYELLLDSNQRQNLDTRQEAESVTKKWVVNETVMLSEMVREEDNKGWWWWECRCGGVYIVNEEKLSIVEEDTDMLVECDTCSLFIEVLVDLHKK